MNSGGLRYEHDRRPPGHSPSAIQDPDFLAGKGLSNEVNIRIFCYAPKYEMAVRQFIRRLQADPTLDCHMFADDISRKINGVIKVDQADSDVREQELNEYIITRELKKHFMPFFSFYSDAFDGLTADIGVVDFGLLRKR